MIVALDADRAVRQGRGGILVVAAVVQGCHRGGEHSDDTKEVRDRVADRRRRGVATGLACRSKCRGVCDRTRESTGDERNLHAHGLADVQAQRGGDAVESHHHQDRADSCLEVMKEGSARVDADREGEECQAQRAQLLGHLQLNTEGLRPCRHDDGEKENGSGTQTDAFDLNLAEGHADADEEE